MIFINQYCNPGKHSFITFCRNVILLFTVLIPAIANCQADDDEIIVSLYVQRIGKTEIPAIIHNQTVYLPVKQVFDFLRIKNTPSKDFNSNEGFFITPKSPFVIDKEKNRIVYQKKTFDVKPNDIIVTGSELYLKSDYFGEVFGLQCAYSFRDLSVTITTTLELPAIIELRQQQMRKNINKLKGEIKPDTTIKTGFALFRLGTADWLVNTTLETNRKSNTNLNLDIGAMIGGGETDIFLNYNSSAPFDPKQQYYRWRYVNDNNRFIKQITAGKIFTQSISSIFAPVTAVRFTNMPAAYRKSYGTYRISDKTEPESIVELYVNNVLVNYTKADAAGFYTFEIPLVYGNSTIRLRIYGPKGDEHSHEEYITIPFNFIPLHQVEYTFTGGIVSDNFRSRFLRGVVNYGLSRQITLGGGLEYLSSVLPGKAMPFLNASIQMTPDLLLSGEYAHGVRYKGVMSYKVPSVFQFDLNYTRYDKGQTSVKNSFLIEEKKAVLSMPLHLKIFKGISRISFNQYLRSGDKYSEAEFLLSGVLPGNISSNITTQAKFIQAAKPSVYTNFSFSIRRPHGLKITPQLKYQYDQQKINMVAVEVEKKFNNRGYVNFSYQRNIDSKNDYISMALRYDFSFAQTSFSIKRSNNITTTIQSAKGSLLYDRNTNSLAVNNQTNIGKGGMIILPFLDINCNGKRDPGEPKISKLSFRINGGHIERSKKDTTIHVLGLNAYASYFLEFDNNFDNAAWQIKNKKISVFVDPNHFTLVLVPVAVLGEVSGSVFLSSSNRLKGLEGISIDIYDSDAVPVTKIITQHDGFFNFMGLKPGRYKAIIDTTQLQKLKCTSSPALSFTILPNKEGDSVEDLKFICRENLKSGCPQGESRDSDHDGVPDCIDKELITPASCFPVDADGVGNCRIHFKETP